MTPIVNVASHLTRMAREHPTQVAIHLPLERIRAQGHSRHRSITFAELNAETDALAHGLNSIGIQRGVRVAMMVPPSAEFFALTFALFKVAAVPVMIDPGMGVKNLGVCLQNAEPNGFIGIPKAHLARRLLGWAKATIRTTVNVGSWRFFSTRSLAELRQLGSGLGPYASPDVQADDLAAILFTSGSTGIAKGVEYTHGIFAAQVEMLRQIYGIEPGEVDLCTFPLFALFGPALGMTCVIPQMDSTRPASIDPAKAMAQVRQFQVTNLFGSPAVIRKLATLAPESGPAPESDRFSTLRRVISAGAPATPTVLERFTKLLPSSVQVFTPYGATESLPVANIGSHEILRETADQTRQGKGVCLGRPVPGVRVEVVAIHDEPIPEWSDARALPQGQIGEFVVQGPTTTQRYFRQDDATNRAKILEPNTGAILHRMGDVGYIDEQGRLWFCGRKSHRVVTEAGPLYTDMVEPIFNQVPGLFRSALVGVVRDGQAIPILCLELDGQRDAAEVVSDVQRLANETESIRPVQTYLIHPGFPVDVRHNSKIFREKLAVWADQKLGRNWKGGPA